jgi:hypothetical protein
VSFIATSDVMSEVSKMDVAEAHNALGNALVQLGKLDAAVTSYGRALAVTPDFAEAQGNLGRALYKQGKLEDAEAAYRRAIAIAPDHAEAHGRLGQILWYSNRIKEGFQSITRYAELSYCAPVCSVPNNEPIPPHKSRHDQEQQDYLTSIGIRHYGTSDIFHLADGRQLAGPALNCGDTNGEVSEQWRVSWPKVIVIDDFLTHEALDSLRKFCWGSTVWREVYKEEGYLGAFPKFGVACPLLAQIADEIPRRYPTVFASHPLTKLWALKYDSQLSGTPTHADFAAINVNLWITPDDANLDAKSGGLVIWDKAAPLDWDFAKYHAR